MAGLDPDDPEFIRQRHGYFMYADGASDAFEQVYDLLFHAVGGNGRTMRAIRKLRHRAEVLREDCLPPVVFMRRLFSGNW